MKTLIPVLFFLLAGQHASAQKNFEGAISYTVTIDDINAPWFSFKAYFKKNKIFIQTFYNKDSLVIPQSANLIDLDSGYSYEIETSENKITQDTIIKNDYRIITPRFSPDSARVILRHQCTYVRYDSVHPVMETAGDMHLWFADSLYFSIPGKYMPYIPYLVISNGTNICLRSSYSTYLTRNGLAQLTTMAEKIEEMQLPDSLFALPKNYLVQKLINPPASIDVLETEMFEIKKGDNPPPPPPPPPPLPPKQIKSKKSFNKKPRQ